MLRHLQIRDLAIIEAVDIEFGPGLTVLTGETGAGKSMLIDALELLCGGRAAADVVRQGAERADLSAVFQIGAVGGALRRLLDEHAIPEEAELLVRRNVGTDGRSRAWLNGQSVPLQVMRSATELLLDIHGQQEFQSLVRPATQRELIDSFGRLDNLAGQVRTAHAAWLTLLNRSLQIEAAASDRHARLDLLRHQVQELEGLQLRPGELAQLTEERTRISHHGNLLGAAQQALQALYESDPPTAPQVVARAGSLLRPVAALAPQLALLPPMLEEAAIRIKEAAEALAKYCAALELDPARQDAIERRLAAIEELARKHHVAAADLGARHAQLSAELADLDGSANDLAALRAQVATALGAYQELARQLSAQRQNAARGFSKAVQARIQELGMGGGRFFVEVTTPDGAEPSPHGIDQIEFKVSTNPGTPPRAVAKIASGGELSRLSLAVQVTCSQQATPTMIFDEVDAGIGGAVAEIVGRQLRALSSESQVLCVTHLPQVAAQGLEHLRVSKHNDGRHTRISVTRLEGEARIEELARMLGGVQVTARAREHAVEMLAVSAKAAGEAAAAAPRRPAKKGS